MSILTDDKAYKAWEAANKKYFQYQSLEFMVAQMLREVDRRCNGLEPRGWLDCSAVRIDRMRRRIQRALSNTECPDYIPPGAVKE